MKKGTFEERNLLNRHAEWLDEFMSADKYIFINPMYNHFLPAELKQYLDLTAVAHKTLQVYRKGSRRFIKRQKGNAYSSCRWFVSW